MMPFIPIMALQTLRIKTNYQMTELRISSMFISASDVTIKVGCARGAFGGIIADATDGNANLRCRCRSEYSRN
jgi:hypothetical protein